MHYSDPLFEGVVPNSGNKYLCSPLFPDGDLQFEGILLKAPAVVYFDKSDRDPLTGAFAPVIVCAAFRFKHGRLALNGSFERNILWIAKDIRTGQLRSGKIRPLFNETQADMSPGFFGLTHEDLKDSYIGEWVNPNLVDLVALPEAEADYDVQALLGAFHSNVVRIRVSRRR